MTRRTNKEVPKRLDAVDMVLTTDGSCRLGHGGWAVTRYLSEDNQPLVCSGSKQDTTSNQMEYEAIQQALAHLYLSMSTWKTAIIRTDSILVVRQVNGEYRVRDSGLKPLHKAVVDGLATLEQLGLLVSIDWYPRSQTRASDFFAKKQSGAAQHGNSNRTTEGN